MMAGHDAKSPPSLLASRRCGPESHEDARGLSQGHRRQSLGRLHVRLPVPVAGSVTPAAGDAAAEIPWNAEAAPERLAAKGAEATFTPAIKVVAAAFEQPSGHAWIERRDLSGSNGGASPA